MPDTATDKILYAAQNGVWFIKLVGNIRYTGVAGFDAFVDRVTHHGKVKDLLVDLNETTYLDSTTLGLLAVLASFVLKQRGFKPKMVSSNPSVTENIENMGLDRVFILLKNDDVGASAPLSEIPAVERDELERARHILTAHKAMMALSEKNREVFHDVVELLEQDLQAKTDEFEVQKAKAAE